MDRTPAIACLAAALAIGCGRPPSLVVGSKDFTEQVILAEIAAQQIERRLGVRVIRKPHLGGTLLAHQALLAGEIDLYPEYSGTALTAILKQPPSTDNAAVFESIRKEYRQRWQLEWLPPLGFNNTFAMVIRGEDARSSSITTLSDAARRDRGWKLGVGYEFEQRPDGLPGLRKAYPFRIIGSPSSMHLGLLYQALEQKQVDMVAGNSTDGLLSVLDVKVLADDRKYFPPYDAAFVVRTSALDRLPALRAAIDELSGSIPDEVMRKLNHEVDGKRRPAAEVAAEFLAQRR
jgi:glycine betaine/choline ABC-type transport system substrate-binding protein